MNREFFRFNFHDPLDIYFRAIWKDRMLLEGHFSYWYKLCNISGGGMSFISNIDISPQDKYYIQFPIEFDVEHVLNGKVVRKSKVDENQFEYAVEFNLKEKDRAKLIKSINYLQTKKNKFIEKKQMSN